MVRSKDYVLYFVLVLILFPVIAFLILLALIQPPVYISMPRPIASREDLAREGGTEATFGGIDFIWVPAGKYEQGGLGGNGSFPPRPVRISRGFWFGKYEVTQAQWESVVGTNPSKFKGAEMPVESVSWPEALKFCETLSLQHGTLFRLPTEAEWEYVCKLSAVEELTENLDSPTLLDYSWIRMNSLETPHPVGTKKANLGGFHDMRGNVYEWCLDTYRGYDAIIMDDPVAAPEKAHSDKVCRGGAFDSLALETLPYYRMYHGVNAKIPNIGLRLVRE